MQRLKADETIQHILLDILDGKEGKNITLRLWVGCLETSKTTRDVYNGPEGMQIRYTPKDRKKNDDSISEKAKNDLIYKAGAQSSLYFELIENKHPERYLEGIPPDSIIRASLKLSSKEKK